MDQAELDINHFTTPKKQSNDTCRPRRYNIPFDMDADILLPGRLNLPHTQISTLEPDFYLNCSRSQQNLPKEYNSSTFDIALDWQAKIVFTKRVKHIHESIHDGPNSTILLVELTTPFDQDGTIVKNCIAKIFKPFCDELSPTINKHTYRWQGRNSRAKTEFITLKRMRETGIRVPTVYACHKHIIFMSVIEKSQNHLQHFIASKCEESVMYWQIVEMMKLLFRKVKLIHTSVSKLNIVVDDQLRCWFLDVGTMIDRRQPNALEILMAECQQVERIFRYRGVLGEDTLTAYDLFADITSITPIHRETWPSSIV